MGDYKVKTGPASTVPALFTGKVVRDGNCMVKASWVEHRPEGRFAGELIMEVSIEYIGSSRDQRAVLRGTWIDEKTKKTYRWGATK